VIPAAQSFNALLIALRGNGWVPWFFMDQHKPTLFRGGNDQPTVSTDSETVARAEHMVTAISGMGQPVTTFTALYAHPTQAFAKIKQLAVIHQ
jgi:hypothetical protein